MVKKKEPDFISMSEAGAVFGGKTVNCIRQWCADEKLELVNGSVTVKSVRSLIDIHESTARHERVTLNTILSGSAQ